MTGQITGWSIVVQTEEGKELNVTMNDIIKTEDPNGMRLSFSLAQDIDNWLTKNIEEKL